MPNGRSHATAPRSRHSEQPQDRSIEDLPAQSRAGASLEVGEDRFNAEGIRRLYEHTGYPLDRREPSARTPKGPDAGLEHDPAQRTKSVLWRRP